MAARKPKSIVAKAERFCSSLMDALNDAVLIFDPKKLKILNDNKCAVSIYGYPREELLGKELQDLTHEVSNYSELVDCGRSLERVHFNKAGEKITFLVSLCLIDYWGRKAVLSIA